MAWSTDALISVKFNRCTFNSKYDVQDFIDEKKEELEVAKKTLSQLAFMTDPKKFCDDDTDPLWWIQHQVDDAIETIEVNGYLIGIAEKVLGGWDESHHQNGLAYDINWEDFDKMQRIKGDYVKCCDKEGNEINKFT